jgi:hypothetical protein
MRPGEPRVSVRLRKIKEFFAHGTKGIVKHDFRGYTDEDRPPYIDPEESYRNKELLGRVRGDWEEIYQQLCEIELQQRQRFEELKKQGIIPKNQGWKKTTPAFVSGIITFSKEAQFEIEDIPEKFDGMTKFAILGVDENEEFITKAYRRTSIEKLDQLAVKFVKEFEKRYGVRAVYLIRHLDETAPHYHFLFENLRDNGKMLSNTFVKPSVIKKGRARPYQINVQEIQDLAGEIFSEIGILRGETKEQRLARGEREYIKDLPKFKDIMQREEERLQEEIEELKRQREALRAEVAKLLELKPPLQKKVKDLEEQVGILIAKVNRLQEEKEEIELYLHKIYEDEDYYICLLEELEKRKKKYEDLLKRYQKLEEFVKEEFGEDKVREIVEDKNINEKWRGYYLRDRDKDNDPGLGI